MKCMTASNQATIPLPTEHGFWEYTTPGAGGMEGFGKDDYQLLLDDMRGAGMNSICIVCKWMTTGYRSKLPFLDQHPDNLVTRSDNELLRWFIAQAAQAGVRVWLGACIGTYPVSGLKSEPSLVNDGQVFRYKMPGKVGLYDMDCPEVSEYAVAVMGEIYELFPGVHGLMVEIEHGDFATAHRIPLYNQWALANNRPSYDQIVRPLTSRYVDLSPWRDYTTHRRNEILHKIESSLRGKGFAGPLSVICETGQKPYAIFQEVNLALFREKCPGWICISYEHTYNKRLNRLGMMEMAVEEPRKAGLTPYYLPRGVMTFAYPEQWPLPMTLPETWQAELEDIARFQPDGVWWFGAGTGSVPEGAHVSIARLNASGFADGQAARRTLLAQIRQFGATSA